MDKKKYIKSLFTRVLISIILFLSISIFVNSSDKNLLLFKNNIYDKTFKFTKVSNWYNKYFGDIVKKPSIEKVVAVNKELTYTNYEKFKDGVELDGVNAVYPFKSGIVVYIGEKEGYGSTVIIQGMDGIDYWYANIDNLSVKLYDYVESDNIIGESKDNKLYLVFMKDGNTLNYEDFLEKKEN